LGEMTSIFEGCEKEEIGIVRKGDVGFGICAFEDAKFDNWRWVDWTTIGRSYNVELDEAERKVKMEGAYILHPIHKLWRVQAVG
jgi:hypothetical protein